MRWLQAEIATGFQKLVTLRLKNTPPEEVLVATVTVWVDTLTHLPITWDEQQDRKRIITAFRTLCQTSDQWPSIKAFLEALPARPPLPMLPKPNHNPTEAKRQIAKLKAMLKTKPIFKRIP